MTAHLPFVAEGVVPACIMPFNPDYSIDFDSYRAHLSHLARVKGVTNICINGNAAQVPAMTIEEQRQTIEQAVDEVGKKVPLVVGIYDEGTQKSADLAAMAERHGASALLVFPPAFMNRGGHLRPEMILEHHKAIAKASGLPIILFQKKYSTGLMYPHDTLLRLCKEIPTVAAIKDGCGDPMLHEHTVKQLQSLERPVSVLSTHSAWLYSSLIHGCKGLLSGAGSVIPDLQAALLAAVRANDMLKAKELSDRMYPLTRIFYASQPLLDMHTRMKEVLVYLGRIKHAVVRLPECPLSAAEREQIHRAVDAVGLKKDGFENLSY